MGNCKGEEHFTSKDLSKRKSVESKRLRHDGNPESEVAPQPRWMAGGLCFIFRISESDLPNIIWRGLIYIVIQPVRVEQLSGRAPAYNGRTTGIIVGEVVGGNINIQALLYIPSIFLGQGIKTFPSIPVSKAISESTP